MTIRENFALEKLESSIRGNFPLEYNPLYGIYTPIGKRNQLYCYILSYVYMAYIHTHKHIHTLNEANCLLICKLIKLEMVTYDINMNEILCHIIDLECYLTVEGCETMQQMHA